MPQNDDVHDAGESQPATGAGAVAPGATARPRVAARLRPFQTIWTSPRSTVRAILAVDPGRHVLLLASLAGIQRFLDRAAARDAGDSMPTLGILGMAVTIGPLGGLIGLWIGSFLIRLVGKWLGGTASHKHIQTALAWASVPVVYALLLWLPLLLFFGKENFTSEAPTFTAHPALTVLAVGIGIADLVLGIWGFVLACHTIAEVQGFASAWRGLANMDLAMIPLLGGIFLLAVVASVFG